MKAGNVWTGHSNEKQMKDSARYAKIVEWSDEDQCYVGSAPGLVLGGCHGSDEKEVFAELCEIVEEAVALYRTDGKPLPPPTAGRDFANKMRDVA
jgi:predicted RNase H-like HicB family nuclease